MFLKKKRNYQESIHDDATGIKETICDSTIGTKSRYVGYLFLKQVKNRVSD